MSGINRNVLDAIGHTPLVRLNRIAEGLASEFYGKIEMMNPGGSVKDRIGFAMIDAAEKEGRLNPGDTIVEATAGNTGVGLALAAAVKGYRCVFVMPDKMSEDKISLLKAYGAEVVITKTQVPRDSPEHYMSVADRLAREIPHAWNADQWHNPNNVRAHYETTGPEIWADMDGRIDAYVGGMGTCGTTTGVGKFLKAKNPQIYVLAFEPEGSVIGGGEAHPYKIEGVGNSYVPEILERDAVDAIVKVSDKDAFNTARRLAREEGLLVGGSSGAAMWAALEYARRLARPQRIVVMLPDTGRNYLSKIFSDRWMQENGFWQEPTRERTTVGQVLPTKEGIPALVAVQSDEVLGDALALMHRYNISQVPVLEGGQVVGSLEETTLMKLIHDGVDPKNQRISPVMGQPLPQIDEGVDVTELYRMLLSGSGGVVVTAAGKPKAVLTRIDLINFYARRPHELRDQGHS